MKRIDIPLKLAEIYEQVRREAAAPRRNRPWQQAR